MYAGIDDIESRPIDYGIQHIWKDTQPSGQQASVQQRSTSRTSIYSTSSSDQEQNNTIMLSVLEPVTKARQQASLAEIEMISNNGANAENNPKRD